MYKLTKPTGYNNCTVINTDTMSSTIIGKNTFSNVCKILTANDYTVPDYDEAWDIEVNKDTAMELAKLTMPIKRPIRSKVKKSSKPVNALDVLLGLAKYE